VIVPWKTPVPESSLARSRWLPVPAVPGAARDAEGGIELVPVRFAEDEHVDVCDRALAGLPFVPGGIRIRRLLVFGLRLGRVIRVSVQGARLRSTRRYQTRECSASPASPRQSSLSQQNRERCGRRR